VSGIPRVVERAFSKRRQAIEDAARTYGYRTARGMELAALRTRRPKRDAKLDELSKNWQAEARTLGFELNSDRQQARRPGELCSDRSRLLSAADRLNTRARLPTSAPTPEATAAQLGHQLGQALRGLDQPSGMAGLDLRLRYKDREHVWER